MKSELHQVLLSCGFRYVRASEIVSRAPSLAVVKVKGFYYKSYDTVGGGFDIVLILKADPSTELPYAYIVSGPSQYDGKLVPHVGLGRHLCYVQEMEANWDPSDLVGLYQYIDRQIQLTLSKSIESLSNGAPLNQELEGEFSAYWSADRVVYLLTMPSDGIELKCFVDLDSSGFVGDAELCVFDSSKDKTVGAKWFLQRGIEFEGKSPVNVGYFKLRPIGPFGARWPPTNLKEVLSWLSNVDKSARNRIVDYFVNCYSKRHFILLDIPSQDIIGFYVSFNLDALGLGTYAAKKKDGRIGKRRRIKHDILVGNLSGRFSVRKFMRVRCVKAYAEEVLTRNRRRKDVLNLGAKSIALIGCGTIGGYLADLLARSGAGCGGQSFHLYDPDNYSPQNFSRHILGASYFGHNKAEAMVDFIKSNSHLNINAKAIADRFLITALALQRYDLVIDVTGRPPISKKIAMLARQITHEARPLVIHGFNDGNGRASKVIVDSGASCYGCLVSDPAFYKNEIDLRFLNKNFHTEQRVECGSTYVPHDAAVSVVTAGLVQAAALQILEDGFPWTYSEYMFECGRSRSPRILPQSKFCKICNAQG